jgi:hypothetical protein
VQIFPHEHAQNNLDAINKSLESLEKGDVKTALDNDLFLVDNNWYAYSFDRETFDFFTNQVMDQAADRLSWGHTRVVGHEDLYDVINSLQDKYDVKNPQVDSEMGALRTAAENQKGLLKTTIEQELAAVTAIEGKLQAISQ